MNVNFTLTVWDIAALGFAVVCYIVAWIVATDKSQKWEGHSREAALAFFVFIGTMFLGVVLFS